MTVPADTAAAVKLAVDAGEYATADDVVRAALREWMLRRASHSADVAALQADIDTGLADIAAGRVAGFDADRVVKRGRTLLARRSPSV